MNGKNHRKHKRNYAGQKGENKVSDVKRGSTDSDIRRVIGKGRAAATYREDKSDDKENKRDKGEHGHKPPERNMFNLPGLGGTAFSLRIFFYAVKFGYGYTEVFAYTLYVFSLWPDNIGFPIIYCLPAYTKRLAEFFLT